MFHHPKKILTKSSPSAPNDTFSTKKKDRDTTMLFFSSVGQNQVKKIVDGLLAWVGLGEFFGWAVGLGRAKINLVGRVGRNFVGGLLA
jgi:hypothetical protein